MPSLNDIDDRRLISHFDSLLPHSLRLPHDGLNSLQKFNSDDIVNLEKAKETVIYLREEVEILSRRNAELISEADELRKRIDNFSKLCKILTRDKVEIREKLEKINKDALREKDLEIENLRKRIREKSNGINDLSLIE